MAVVKMRPRNLAHLNRDRGYRFSDDGGDPVREEISRLITDSGLSIGDIIDRIYDLSGGAVNMSWSTIANWQSGRTKRPMNATVSLVACALGYERTWRRIR